MIWFDLIDFILLFCYLFNLFKFLSPPPSPFSSCSISWFHIFFNLLLLLLLITIIFKETFYFLISIFFFFFFFFFFFLLFINNGSW